MPARKPSHTLLNCPHCGHQQSESRAAFSAVCKACGQYFRVQDVLNPAPKAPSQTPQRKRIACPDCSTEFDVAFNAQSTMCKRCSAYIDLLDYDISTAVSKNFRTDGTFVVQPRGYVFNTEAIVGDALIRGRFLGKLVAKRSLTIFSTAEIKGTFTAAKLIIPEANHFRWPETIRVGSAEIAGELTGRLRAEETILLKSTARMFGELEACNLVVEEGAVVVGHARIQAANR